MGLTNLVQRSLMRFKVRTPLTHLWPPAMATAPPLNTGDKSGEWVA